MYTKIHHTIYSGEKFPLDLTHDGHTNFILANLVFPGSQAIMLRVVPLSASGYAMVGASIWDAAALPYGAKIGVFGEPSRELKRAPLQQFSSVMFAYGYPRFYYTYGSWRNTSERYLGLGFKVNGERYYGWARLSTTFKDGKITALLTGFAYETEPNHPIRAGATGQGDDASLGPEPESGWPARHDHQVSIGALALGAPGLPLWRPED
ncbi:MAG TPA: hypothetical protein VND65_03200 [Candidatus Binatia bacterium]|nr:hypothetical protein [Candidatus Binatia bacterium]